MLQRRWIRFLLASLLILAVVLAASLHYAARTLKPKIEAALGPNSTVGSISVGLLSVEIGDLHVKAAPGWPAQEVLSARRVVLVPAWFSLFSDEIVLQKVRMEEVYVSVLRTRKGGLQALPGILEKRLSSADRLPAVRIRSAVVSGGTLEFFDAAARSTLHKVRLEQVDVRVTNLALPDLSGVSQVDASGILKGGKRDGSFVLAGDIELGSLDSEMKTTLRGVELAAIKPYVIKDPEMIVRRGTLDLDMESRIRQRRLKANGSAMLRNFELESTGGLASMPHRMAAAVMENGQKDIHFKFVLNGGLDDPAFSFADSFALRFGLGLADALGVSVGSLGEAAGSLFDTIRGWFK